MALFSSKKKTEAAKPAAAKAAPAQSAIFSGNNVAHVLKNPRITEKASDLQGLSVYTFDIATNATKTQVAQAVKSVYKVTPRKVRVVSIAPKMRRNARTGKVGMTTAGKKAYVYLANGESITVA